MIPYTTLDSIIAQMPERTGHTLLDEDQEGFFVLDGKGYALIGDEEIPLLPGTAFMVPAHTDHVIRRDPSCDCCKVLWFHAAVE